MFTGLIEALGTLVEVKPVMGGFRVRIATDLAGELAVGDSLAVNGVCLTATVIDGGEVHAEVGPETARVTTLGSLHRGQPVNLERAMRVDGRLGGHFVQGHIDGVGVVDEIRPDATSHWLTFGFPPALAPFFIRKGSVAVDGISLTVAGLGEKQFDVQVISHTWAHTNLKALRPGDRVNLECDVLGKYVVRAAGLLGFGETRPQTDPS
jgi:riboflavin synthase